jgi:tryptophan synthase alpha chain
MTHLVLGYPSLEVNRAVIAAMVAGGVDCIELQIPFSEPMADGPVILKANQEALATGIRVEDCLRFAEEMAAAHPGMGFLFMTYYNIVFRYGEERFLGRTAEIGFKGLIIPDLPPEEGAGYLSGCARLGLAPILFFTPTSTDARMREVAALADGFIYCVARKGVTGGKTSMDANLDTYLARCRAATDLPLALGFGIGNRDDVAMITGKVDMAVIGTRTIRLVDEEGPGAVEAFICGLRRG